MERAITSRILNFCSEKVLLLLMILGTVLFWSQYSRGEPVPDSDVQQSEGWEAASPEPDDPQVHWLDNSHLYLTDRTQALANWMDSFFGDTEYDSEQAESIVRVELSEDWNNLEGGSTRVKIRGRVHLPRLSKRLSLVFNADEEDEGAFDDLVPGQQEEDRVGLQLRGRETKRSRFDYTMGWASGNPRPGIRYRNQGALGDRGSYRLTERIQYEHKKKFYSKTNFRISQRLTDNRIMNWSSRINYGEKTEGVEWSTSISWLNRYRVAHDRPIAASFYVAASGVTRPDSYVSNYALGLVYRRQLFRDYLFLEFEPSVNYRQLDAQADRELMWRAILRFEIALSKEPVGLR